ncbi:MAG: T9SS type A sorting domain-containing protein [Gracilimonas sp.]|nr:T9SS type A sorting domain-containing protein [Gracilimonas sp.]
MAAKLLSENLVKYLHIALLILISLWGVQVNAQSVLLPGDVAVVSVNASNNSVDLIPLIDIEKGTVINLSAGKWDPSAGLLTGTEATLYFKRSVQAGSNIHVDGNKSETFDFSGRLPFLRSQNQFYVFQKEENVYRFIYGLSFGVGNVDSETLATEIPPVLNETENTFVQLGEKQNHQYFIRNGASGTQNMLLGFLGDSESWNSSDRPFLSFGTSFNVLTPPVVMFKNTSSSFTEGDSTATLEVTIYEHDGSRVSVDVEFEETYSSADSLDFSEFKTKTLNFTGLVGTYTTEIPLPIAEDESFEGREGAIFYLRNLTGGSMGDFISHSVAIEDNRVPSLVITNVSNTTDQGGFIEVSNLENTEVSLKGWIVATDNSRLRIDSSVVLGAYKKIRLYDATQEQVGKDLAKSYNLKGLNRQLLNGDGGVLSLKNYNGKIVHQVGYRRSRTIQNSAIAADRSQNNAESEQSGMAITNSEISSAKQITTGWKISKLSSDAASALPNHTSLYAWDDRSKAFMTLNSIEDKNVELPVLGFFEENELESLNDIETQFRTKENVNSPITFSLSAIDLDNNGSIEGAEGLNLLENPLEENLVVGTLIEMIRENLGSTNSVEVFQVDKDSDGSLNFEALNQTDVVTADSYFWIKLEKEMETALIEMDRDDLITASRELSGESEEQLSGDIGFLKLNLKADSKQRNVDLFIDPENGTNNKTDLNAYPELLPEEHTSLIFSVKQSEDFYNSVSIPGNTELVVSLPVSFGSSTNDSYTLSIDEWEKIPSEWSIKLIDTYNDKEYDLRSDFSLTFDHSFNNTNENQNSERFEIQLIPEAAKQQAEEIFSDVPKEIELNQNYPNPFNPVTTISFYLPESQEVKLSIFNIVGQPVAVLFEGRLSSGRQQFEWDATDKPSGMYIYQLEVGDKVMTRKMTLVK